MARDTPTPIAFVQLDAERFACSAGGLVPSPTPPRAAFLAPWFSLDPRHGWWLEAPGGTVPVVDRGWWREHDGDAERKTFAIPWEAPEEERFRNAFASLRSLLDQGCLVKGVPFTRMRATLPADEAWPLFQSLRGRVLDLPHGLIAYGLFLPGTPATGPEFMIGATPELLFEMSLFETSSGVVSPDDESVFPPCDRVKALPRRILRTMAVAGTRRVEAGAAGALAASVKDEAEHRAVVEDLLAQTRPWGAAHVLPTAVRQFGDLYHLVTGIELAPDVAPDVERLVRALHPTPALGVSPRGAQGTAWLRACDPLEERRRFGAPFGVRLCTGDTRAIVAIRSLQYAAGQLEIWAGCGVVATSRYDEEWREITDKMNAVRALWRV